MFPFESASPPLAGSIETEAEWTDWMMRRIIFSDYF
jgi:hypothetical protein